MAAPGKIETEYFPENFSGAGHHGGSGLTSPTPCPQPRGHAQPAVAHVFCLEQRTAPTVVGKQTADGKVSSHTEFAGGSVQQQSLYATRGSALLRSIPVTSPQSMPYLALRRRAISFFQYPGFPFPGGPASLS